MAGPVPWGTALQGVHNGEVPLCGSHTERHGRAECYCPEDGQGACRLQRGVCQGHCIAQWGSNTKDKNESYGCVSTHPAVGLCAREWPLAISVWLVGIQQNGGGGACAGVLGARLRGSSISQIAAGRAGAKSSSETALPDGELVPRGSKGSGTAQAA
ncbi:unnamed protein product [Natator depressus]